MKNNTFPTYKSIEFDDLLIGQKFTYEGHDWKKIRPGVAQSLTTDQKLFVRFLQYDHWNNKVPFYVVPHTETYFGSAGREYKN